MLSEKDHIFDLYHDEIRRLSLEQQSSSAVLYCSVLAVVNGATHSDPEQNQRNHSIAPITEHYTPAGEFVTLQTAGATGSFQGLIQSIHSSYPIHSDIMVTESDDNLTGRIIRNGETTLSNNQEDYTRASTTGLILFEKQATVRSLVSQLLSGKELPLKPSMTSTERGIKETELLSFSSLSASDLYRNDQMQVAAKMLEAHVKALPNFTGTLHSAGDDGAIIRRRYFRQLSAQTFAQILSAERVREPVVVQQYYPLSDDLLLALHWPAPERRTNKESWSWTGLIPVLTVAPPVEIEKGKSSKGKKGKGSVKTPVEKKKKKGQSTEPEPPTTITCSISTTTLTPAAHSIALIKRSADPSAKSWLTILLNGSVLGLRMETTATLTADYLAQMERAESIVEQRSAASMASTARSHESMSDALAEGSTEEVEEGVEGGAEGAAEGTPEIPPRTSSQPQSAGSGGRRLSGAASSTVLNDDPPRGVFFCQTEDDVRFSACLGPIAAPNRKPDGFGTVCLIATFPDTTTITVCSNGTTKFTLPQPVAYTGASRPATPGSMATGAAQIFDTVVGVEAERFIGAGGTVMSVFNKNSFAFTNSDGSTMQFWKEIREADGSRLLIVRPAYSPTAVAASLADAFGSLNVAGKGVESTKTMVGKPRGMTAFYQNLCAAAPAGWTSVKLYGDGRVVFHCTPPDSPLLDTAEGVPHPTLNGTIRQFQIDAESKSTVNTFMDGRIIIEYADGRRECRFGDGTVITTHSDGAMVSVVKPSLPAVEIDTEIDAVSRQHARGIEVPINKGGERVRSRIALSDGSAVLVKYDTRLTTTTNGSIKLVRRDKTTLLLKDSGTVIYSPRASWNTQAAATFAAECADLPKPPSPAARSVNTAASMMMSTAGAPTSPTSRASTTLATHSVTSKATTAAAGTKRGKLTVTAPGLSRRRTSPTRGRTAGSTTAASLMESEGEKQKDDTEDAATFTFDITKFTCRILDYEFNSFDIALGGDAPLDPLVVLSGEVEGLKPPAVADKPMEPRLFVVNRAAEATELLSTHQVSGLETLVRTCPDVKKLTQSVHLSPAELGPATLNKYFIQRRVLGSHGDAFSFEEVFGERYWYPHSVPAAALLAERNNRALQQKWRRKRVSNEGPVAVPPPARYFETVSLVEQQPLSIEGHVELQNAIKKCEQFRTQRMQSLDRFKVEEDRSQEELDEEEALAKRLKLAFKAAKVAAAKRREQRAKIAASAPAVAEESQPGGSVSGAGMLKRGNGMIPEGVNEDGEEDEEDLDFPGDDDEPKEVDPEEQEVRDTFEDFSLQDQDGHAGDEGFTIYKSDLQNAFIRLFNRFIAQDVIDYEIHHCEECDPSFEELTYVEFKTLYYSMKAHFASGESMQRDHNLVINTELETGSLASQTKDSEEHSVISSPMYWQSAQGRQVLKSLPAAAPPLDLRKLINDPVVTTEESNLTEFDDTAELYEQAIHDQIAAAQLHGRMVSTAQAHPAVGSALQAARRSNTNRAVTAPE